MKVTAVIQARMGSTRLKGKTLMKLAKYTLLDTVINSVKRNKFIDDVIIVTTTLKEDDILVEHCKKNEISYIRGDSEDVLSRFITVAKQLDPEDVIIRVTADNPLNNPFATQKLFEKHIKENNDYTYVEGLSHLVYEFVKVDALLKLGSFLDLEKSDKEHVTMYLRRKNKLFKNASANPTDLGLKSNLDSLLTIDSVNDYKRFQEMKSEIDIDNELDFEIIYKWLNKYSFK